MGAFLIEYLVFASDYQYNQKQIIKYGLINII